MSPKSSHLDFQQSAILWAHLSLPEDYQWFNELAGAQKVVKIYEGKFPDNAKEMEANVPGIGRNSAGAICSIAYGERVPVLDGNVHRLFSRFLVLHALPKSKATLDVFVGCSHSYGRRWRSALKYHQFSIVV